ncbi:MAG: 3-hydroxyacyl-CoA dehydrogenase NAD-binding domain-containing protein [candidate division KSB1 bacterium]|nr:3-hydroxyacyl-CoA dehydrogenase NAD-binding domain-containing protein [candidate division KSB1 bacterium]MDZ7273280.1 3-hydroxyacyl-CoA dehydrogenase NAD-binding domain-containing protein [candidate division KSB1 bacterium]MDZ7285382.1 3-hydroxyacyl-CoA dehydrogenase NAD-binding domain-containing protein [candidate division KSB1 bacterium]MDZ7298414.1 3-hydroxyacyl-CoA dehydrogenase NAD-binding domain-containing protein [candidate division KSB1 bacterium]MDZ7307679.1 3-hydroxyacyl-CoA dehydr
MPSTIQRLAVIGAGTMGRGIAYASCLAGFATRLYDVAAEILHQAGTAILADFRKAVDKKIITEEIAAKGFARLQTTTDLALAAQDADFIIEAIPERIDLKLDLFARLDKLAPASAIFATNTSSLSITEMAGATQRPGQVVGMHFFNPVPVMKLVEIIRGLESSEAAIALTQEVAQQMGKETVSINESPGFITTRINALIGNEAFYLLQEGVASAREIDKALKLGLNHPMGPFELVDLVGLDVRLNILNFLHQTLGEKFRPCPLLVKYVKAGRLGKKVGRGVYEYV